MTLTYPDYLKLETLLGLQEAQSDPPEHDEMLFIVIHQAYEVWFKLLLHEIDKIKTDFSDNDLFGSIATWKRVRMVLKTLVSQVDILETMTPMHFTSFRVRLDTASGLQSAQFREIECVLGYKRPDTLRLLQSGTPGYAKVEKRLAEKSVVDHFYDLLEKRGAPIPAELREKDITLPTVPNTTIQDCVLQLYRDVPEMTYLIEAMTDVDEGLQEWRYRHVKLVERTIGSKQGTAGTLGVKFLKKSLFHPVFPDLWAIRHRL